MSYDDRQSRRLNTLLAVAGVLIALCAAIISLLLYEHETQKAEFHPAAIVHRVGATYVQPR